MTQYDVIMFGMSNYSEWDRGVSNRNYHVLKELLNKPEVNKVLYVDYLPLTWKRALRILKQDIFVDLKNSQVVSRGATFKVSKLSEKLFVYTDISFVFSPMLTINNIKKLSLKLNFGDLVLWSLNPFIAPFWQKFGAKLVVFDAVDNWLSHSSYTKLQARLKKCYDLVKSEADIIFTVSKNLLNFFEDQPNVHWIPNGVDFIHYNKQYTLVNRDISDIKKPIIGYIGIIQEKVDLDLVHYLAEKNPDKSIVLVGPIWDEQTLQKKELSSYQNIYWLGHKSYEEAPMYIQQFTIGIVPHRANEFSASTNPMKVYEYLACGKPVVSTENVGTENMNDVIKVASGYEDFNQQVNLELKNDSSEKIVLRQEFAKKYSWYNTVEKMLDIINKKLI
ncbi:MAG: glycosyltransferase [Patescibacteria group bacterium]|jgi:glycosyltransferase involved in cell wall biosynthesis